MKKHTKKTQNRFVIIGRFIIESKSTFIGLILSFSLMTTFATRLDELVNELYPAVKNYQVVGSVSTITWLDPITTFLNSKVIIILLLLLTIAVFIIELITLIRKILKKKPFLQG